MLRFQHSTLEMCAKPISALKFTSTNYQTSKQEIWSGFIKIYGSGSAKRYNMVPNARTHLHGASMRWPTTSFGKKETAMQAGDYSIVLSLKLLQNVRIEAEIQFSLLALIDSVTSTLETEFL